MPAETLVVSRRAARRFLIRRTGLGRAAGEPARWPAPGDTIVAVRTMEYVQVDPMSVLGRSQDLVLGARVGGYTPETLDHFLYDERRLVEVLAFDRCIVPVEDYPLFRLRFREVERRERPGLEALEPVMRDVLARIQAEGPLSSLDFEGGPKISGWWDAEGEARTKAARQALEWLWHFGRLAISRREGLRRYFDLPERVFGEKLLAEADRLAGGDLATERRTLRDGLVRKYLRAMGLASPRRLHFGFLKHTAAERKAVVEEFLEAGKIVPVRVEGSPETYYAPAAEAADLAAAGAWEPAPEVHFLAPLDNLIWDRERLADVFGFAYTWEAYVPPAKRRYCPYTCPILWGDRLVGRVDARLERAKTKRGEAPEREVGPEAEPRTTLVVNGLWWEEERGESGGAGTDCRARGERPSADELRAALEDWAASLGASAVADPGRVLPGPAAHTRKAKGHPRSRGRPRPR